MGGAGIATNKKQKQKHNDLDLLRHFGLFIFFTVKNEVKPTEMSFFIWAKFNYHKMCGFHPGLKICCQHFCSFIPMHRVVYVHGFCCYPKNIVVFQFFSLLVCYTLPDQFISIKINGSYHLNLIPHFITAVNSCKFSWSTFRTAVETCCHICFTPTRESAIFFNNLVIFRMT